MTTQTEEPTKKRDQLVAVIAAYKKTDKDYSTRAAFLYIKTLTAYSDDNCILILEQCRQRVIDPFTLTAIRGFSAWLDVGRVVRKGEKCFYILAPLIKRDDERRDTSEMVIGFKCAFVFDERQTDMMNADEQEAARTAKAERQAKSTTKQEHTTARDKKRRPRAAKAEQTTRQSYAEEARQRAEEARQHAQAERERQRAPRSRAAFMSEGEARILLSLRGPITEAALKSAYRAAAKIHHPDYGGSEAAMKRINDARDVLQPLAH